jgi:hypothetical protein
MVVLFLVGYNYYQRGEWPFAPTVDKTPLQNQKINEIRHKGPKRRDILTDFQLVK